MAGLMRREARGEAPDMFSRFDRLFEEWMRNMPFRAIPFQREAGDLIKVEEYQDEGMMVIRADLPGINPDKDVEVTVSGGMLHIGAERQEEAKREEKGYLRHEVHYGSMSRSLPLPGGVTDADITANYKDGVLEIRIPEPKRETATKIAIGRS